MEKIELDLYNVTDEVPDKEMGYYVSITLFFSLILLMVISPVIMKKSRSNYSN